MNPLSNVRFIKELNEREVKLGINDNASWHNQYKDSAWIFVGGLSYDLTEGDVLCVFSQYGEIVNINLIRDKLSGQSKGYGFICYEDQRSTILAVDNFNGIKLSGRTIRVDHVANYRVPKDFPDTDEATKRLREEGCAPSVVKKNTEPDIIEIIPSDPRNDSKTKSEKVKPEDEKIKKEKDDFVYEKNANDSEKRRTEKSKRKHSSPERHYSGRKSHRSRRSRSKSRSRSRSPRHRNKRSHRSPSPSKSRHRRRD